MFTEYVAKAMHRADYEVVDDGTYVGSIPGFDGVLGTGNSVEECRDDLRRALEGWLVLGLWMNDESLPKLGKLDLVPRKFATSRKHEPAVPARPRKAS
jgi:predicted RNase H-like HicB family nuclease